MSLLGRFVQEEFMEVVVLNRAFQSVSVAFFIILALVKGAQTIIRKEAK